MNYEIIEVNDKYNEYRYNEYRKLSALALPRKCKSKKNTKGILFSVHGSGWCS